MLGWVGAHGGPGLDGGIVGGVADAEEVVAPELLTELSQALLPTPAAHLPVSSSPDDGQLRGGRQGWEGRGVAPRGGPS